MDFPLSGLNQFFFFRFPSVNITSLVAQLLSYPVGRFFAAVLPRKKIFGVSINPGPFSVKEHVYVSKSSVFCCHYIKLYAGWSLSWLVSVPALPTQRTSSLSNVCTTARSSISHVSLCYPPPHCISCAYNTVAPHVDQWFVVMSTQMIGFSIGGVAKRFLVSPPSMSTFFSDFPPFLGYLHLPWVVWPTNLVYCALFNTLHSQEVSLVRTSSETVWHLNDSTPVLVRAAVYLVSGSSHTRSLAGFSGVCFRSLSTICTWLTPFTWWNRLFPRLHLPGALGVQLGVLDCSQQHQGQRHVRVCIKLLPYWLNYQLCCIYRYQHGMGMRWVVLLTRPGLYYASDHLSHSIITFE